MTETIGSRLLAQRRRRRMSQRDLADLAHVHIDVIRKLEQEVRQSARLETITALAEVLGVPAAQLLGVEPGLPGRQQADVLALRAAIYGQATADVGALPTIDRLRSATDDMWLLYWDGRLGQLATELPRQLTTARGVAATVPAAQRREALAALAGVLQMAARLAAHLAYEDLAQVALLQAIPAAEEANDPVLLAMLQSCRAWVLSRQGLWSHAERVAAAAAADIEPSLSRATVEEIAVWGCLLHFGTVALARDGRETEARELLRLVDSAAGAMGNRRAAVPGMVPFGSAFAVNSAVTTAVAVDQPREALQVAERAVDVDTLPPIVRARYLLNVAYAQALDWRSQESVDTLRRVDAVAPEVITRHGLARAAVEELLPRRRTQRLPGLAQLAGRLGISTE